MRILVLGDCCLDEFVYASVERLAPDGPVPVLDIVEKTTNYGMAGNVVANIRALDCKCDLITNTNFKKIKKTRLVDLQTNHLFLRIDKNDKVSRIDCLREIDWSKYNAVVISDYNKGFLLEEDIYNISLYHKLTFLDSKKLLGSFAKNITFIKINRHEYKTSLPYLTQEIKDKIIVTLGKEGCQYRETIYPVKDVEIKNLSGAGDSFLAGLVVKYLETSGNIEQALAYANTIATIIIQKKGVSTIKS